MADPVRSEPRRVRLSLRTKLTLGLILIIGALFVGVNMFNIISSARVRRSEALQNSATVANLVAGALLDPLADHAITHPTVRRVANNFLRAALIKRNKDLACVVIVNAQGKVVTGRARQKLVVFPGNKRFDDQAKLLGEIARLKKRRVGDLRFTRFPLQVGKELVGKVIVGTSFARLERELQRDLILNGAILAGTLLLLVLYTIFALRGMVIKPLSSVTDAMRAVQAGDLEREINIKSNDEMGVLADTYNYMVEGLRERERLQDAFNRYVSKQVYEKFQAGEIALTGQTRNATILFSDIRSFTALSERLTPPDVVAMLNEYFTEMVEIVFRYEGFVNKFIGDALMAIYNVPLDQDNPELRAVKTAHEMTLSLQRLNAVRKERGEFPIKIGIGVNTGPVVAGNLGHIQRLEYTVIGDAVNLAQRIESQTKVAGYPVLLSETTYAAVRNHVEVEVLPPVKVKGKQEPVPLYALQALK